MLLLFFYPVNIPAEPGQNVDLPCRAGRNSIVTAVEWKDSRGRTVHVYQNGSDQPGEQKQIYRTRTKMDKNLLKNKDLSLTLTWPTFGDSGIYTCIVSTEMGTSLAPPFPGSTLLHLFVPLKVTEVTEGTEGTQNKRSLNQVKQCKLKC
uniref:Ig-like domain-containing protein n=1 Tax=Xiphophorus maculatus TaxID=8083 RepID=A0A3B5Q887_XIPMA